MYLQHEYDANKPARDAAAKLKAEADAEEASRAAEVPLHTENEWNIRSVFKRIPPFVLNNEETCAVTSLTCCRRRSVNLSWIVVYLLQINEKISILASSRFEASTNTSLFLGLAV